MGACCSCLFSFLLNRFLAFKDTFGGQIMTYLNLIIVFLTGYYFSRYWRTKRVSDRWHWVYVGRVRWWNQYSPKNMVRFIVWLAKLTTNKVFTDICWINVSIWATTRQPLPQPNINPKLLLVYCCWFRGGVGAHFFKHWHWSHLFLFSIKCRRF